MMKTHHILLLAATVALSACAGKPPTTTPVPSTLVRLPMTPVAIGCAYHEGTSYIYSFYVQEPYSQLMLGGTSCGGINAAGYILPIQWQPGMKVKVRWKPNARDWIEKTTTIRRYDEAGDLFVHFFANDEVRVVSSARYSPQSPMHPIPKSVTIAPPEEE
ncbi:DUF3304 domain-containing protein [Paraherbaspirillum soli]|uniref:DUF3304 domain-containing protein n=1 Tax=Paraherbaspirillum soli TaxID=631222 RepID=A0ABW0M8V1_9BURK